MSAFFAAMAGEHAVAARCPEPEYSARSRQPDSASLPVASRSRELRHQSAEPWWRARDGADRA